jgi:hypothetical protein
MKGKLEDFIQKHNEELDQRTPNPAVLDRIMRQMGHENLFQEKVKERKGIVISFRTLQWSAAACLVLALGLALWKYQETSNSKGAMVTKIPGRLKPVNRLTDTATATSINMAQAKPKAEQQRFNEVDQDLAYRKKHVAEAWSSAKSASYKQVLLDKLDNEGSPASRISALSQADKLHNISNDVVDVLVETMNNDPNTNVRLAALDGLTKFYREGYVKKQLIRSLKKQHDPMVQIALIGLLTRMKESAILAQLEGMTKDDNNIDAVKETAYSSIFELRGS